MDRKQYERAAKLADRLVEGLVGAPDLRKTAVQLRAMLTPPLTAEELLAKVPGATHNERAKALGISRQGFYNLRNGLSRPNPMLARLLAELTRVPEAQIRGIW